MKRLLLCAAMAFDVLLWVKCGDSLAPEFATPHALNLLVLVMACAGAVALLLYFVACADPNAGGVEHVRRISKIFVVLLLPSVLGYLFGVYARPISRYDSILDWPQSPVIILFVSAFLPLALIFFDLGGDPKAKTNHI